jgi:ElaB/YqjD/DUF883 family membrane-anchored ribosome-binding protein
VRARRRGADETSVIPRDAARFTRPRVGKTGGSCKQTEGGFMSQFENGGEPVGLRDEASTRVQEAAQVAQEKASELKERGSSRIQTELDGRSSQLGEQLLSLARSLRSSTPDATSGGGAPTKLVAPAADQLERAGSYLQETSGDELMGDIESFARERPWMMAATGLLAGVAAARFVKASADRRATGGAAGVRRVSYPPASAAPTAAVGTVGTIGREPAAAPAYSAR